MSEALPWGDRVRGRRWLREREIRLTAARAALAELRDAVTAAFRDRPPFHLVYVRDRGWVWRSAAWMGPRRVYSRAEELLAALAGLPASTAAWYADIEARRVALTTAERLLTAECAAVRRWLADAEALHRNPFASMQD